jgi:hypothetical protein
MFQGFGVVKIVITIPKPLAERERDVEELVLQIRTPISLDGPGGRC